MSTYDTLMQGIKKNEKPQQEEKKLEDNKVSPTQSSELNEPQFRSSANNQSIETGDLQNRSFAEPQKASPKSPTLKRKVTYQGIGIYEDQFFKLRRLQAEILDATHILVPVSWTGG
jgi:hypothetical protein